MSLGESQAKAQQPSEVQIALNSLDQSVERLEAAFNGFRPRLRRILSARPSPLEKTEHAEINKMDVQDAHLSALIDHYARRISEIEDRCRNIFNELDL